MELKIFKTRKLAEEYISETYPAYSVERTVVGSNNNYETEEIDLGDEFWWLGEMPAFAVLDDNDRTVEYVAYHDEGDRKYELFIGGELKNVFDNIIDARAAKKQAVEDEEWKDEGEALLVTLLCDGEDITY